MAVKLHHHARVVGHMDRAIELYSAGLGMRLLRRKPGVAFAEVAMLEDPVGGGAIELLLVPDLGETHFDRVAFEVDDVDEAFHRLPDDGCTSQRPPFDVAGGSVRTSFVMSPDGTKIELIRYQRDNTAT